MSNKSHFDIARALLKVHEGLRTTEYVDTTGNRTIGYGWNLDAKPLPTGVGTTDTSGKMVITKSEAEGLLDQSMLAHWTELIAKLPWVGGLDEWRQAALLDMAFNMGIPTLLTFKNTLNDISAHRFKDAAARMLESRWSTQVKKRSFVLADIIRFGAIPAELEDDYDLIPGWEYF
jgi:lysozyme